MNRVKLLRGFEPLAHYIKDEFKSKFCDNCGKRSDQLKNCSKCHQMYYCDKECQQNDWKCHKFECKVYRHPMWKVLAHMMSYDLIRLDLRSWLCYDLLPNYCTDKRPTLNGSDICLNDIRADLSDLLSDPSKDFERFAVESLRKGFEICGLTIDHDKFLQWHRIMKRKIEFSIPYPKTDDLIHECVPDFETNFVAMVYIFQVSPFVNHSCLPNAYYEFEGFDLQLRAIRPIAKGDKITMSFINLKQDKAGRETEMLNKGIPLCQCNRCRLHLDKGLDYKEFLEMHSKCIKIGKAINHGHSESQCKRKRGNKIDFNHILYLKEIFGEYHPIVCKVLVTSYVFFAENSRYASKSLLRLSYKEIEPIVLKTHGADHQFYKSFQTFALNYITI